MYALIYHHIIKHTRAHVPADRSQSVSRKERQASKRESISVSRGSMSRGSVSKSEKRTVHLVC